MNENNKICYTVQNIKVHDNICLPCYAHSMYLQVKVSCWNNTCTTVQTTCFAGSTLLRDNAWKKRVFLPTDTSQKCTVGKGQTKYFFSLGLMLTFYNGLKNVRE